METKSKTKSMQENIETVHKRLGCQIEKVILSAYEGIVSSQNGGRPKL